MPAQVLYPNVGAMNGIGLIRTNLVNCKVKLFKTDLMIGPTTVIGDLVEADYSGYVAETVLALLAAYLDPVGGGSAQIATLQFQHSGGVVSNTVFGAWVETAAGVLVLLMKFEAGVPMVVAADAIPLDVKFNFGN